jgi:hypothetical protein
VNVGRASASADLDRFLDGVELEMDDALPDHGKERVPVESTDLCT